MGLFLEIGKDAQELEVSQEDFKSGTYYKKKSKILASHTNKKEKQVQSGQKNDSNICFMPPTWQKDEEIY